MTLPFYPLWQKVLNLLHRFVSVGKPSEPRHIAVPLHINPTDSLSCTHPEWTEETRESGWRSYCTRCGIRSEGSCQ